MNRVPFRLALITTLLLAMIACGTGPSGPFDAPQTLGGETVAAATLNSGYQVYSYYCVSCHGPDGDGRGTAAEGLQTQPRDLRLATYKFAGAPEGSLPLDKELARVVSVGLDGTAMLRWELSEGRLDTVIQYIKTFSPAGEGWRDPDMERAGDLAAKTDPWEGDTRSAIARGEAIYHGLATCNSCHPAYVTRDKINGYRAEFNKPATADYRPAYWQSEPKLSSTYSQPVDGDLSCSSDSDCKSIPDGTCRMGRCEQMTMLLPPDFLFNELRSGSTPSDVFRTLYSGLPGTAMPEWGVSLGDKDNWALAHFVSNLVSLSGTNEGWAIQTELRADTAPLVLEVAEPEQAPPEDESEESESQP